jgi:hypothetical protein
MLGDLEALPLMEIETRGSALTLMGGATFQLPCPIFPSSILDHRLSGCRCAVGVTCGGSNTEGG